MREKPILQRLTLNIRFVDRDMLMRYHLGLGVGHTYFSRPTSRPKLSLVKKYKDEVIIDVNGGLLPRRDPNEGEGDGEEGSLPRRDSNAVEGDGEESRILGRELNERDADGDGGLLLGRGPNEGDADGDATSDEDEALAALEAEEIDESSESSDGESYDRHLLAMEEMYGL